MYSSKLKKANLSFIWKASRIYSWLCWAALIFFARPGLSYDFTTAAKQAIAIEYQTGAILFKANAEEKMAPSSMSKLMTLYVAFGKLRAGIIKEDDHYIVSKKAWSIGGSSMFLKQGQKVKVKDLLYGIAVDSGNDACITLAEGSMGSEEAYVAEMNKMAKRLTLNQSHFANSSGWPDKEHYMSAYDLAQLAMQIYKDFPEYYYLFSEKQFKFNDITQNNSNELLWKDLGADGMKTGRTESGGFGIVASAQQETRRVIIVVNGLSSNKQRIGEAERLLRFSFANFYTKTILKKGKELGTINIIFGSKNNIPLILEEDLIITYPKETNYGVHNKGLKLSKKEGILVTLTYEDNLKAPIIKGQQIGRLTISNIPGKPEKTIIIRATEEVKEISLLRKFLLLGFNF